MLRTSSAITALVVLMGCAACGTDPGAVVALTSPAPPGSPAVITPDAAVALLPSPSPPVAPGGLVAVTVPALRGMFAELNRNTAETARGEMALIDQVSAAMRGELEKLLNGVSSR